MSMEDQFEDERKTLNEALLQNETQIRQLEMKSKNAEEQRECPVFISCLFDNGFTMATIDLYRELGNMFWN